RVRALARRPTAAPPTLPPPGGGAGRPPPLSRPPGPGDPPPGPPRRGWSGRVTDDGSVRPGDLLAVLVQSPAAPDKESRPDAPAAQPRAVAVASSHRPDNASFLDR